ncbi:nitrous oxide reductase accessory protein NosL [Tamlana sp. I1]|uniref:nitrous oxide reductase accessory protein NosL n=1 Tax=Tamlana sp. I1 TaxID=2762061 RepID=UPI00188FB318|nr:nitrous oxide reductase accessory protein NosL [Tamlana sp. I1]
MKTILKTTLTLIALVVLCSCNSGPQAIDYGNDGCHFCKMTIVDKIHASELITDKGKVLKFDATECMLNFVEENNTLSVKEFLTNYYEAPTAFINAKEAIFLISKNLPSPMGAYLTAFKTKKASDQAQKEHGGKLYTWESLKAHLINKAQ